VAALLLASASLVVYRSRRRAPALEETAPDVFCLGIGSGVMRSNVYFVRSGPSWSLLDAAWPNRGELIRRAAASLFGAQSRPSSILLTHIHPDHSGSAPELARTWGVPVYVHPAELPLAPGRYVPEYGNPLDRRVIVPLLRLLPARSVEAMAPRGSLLGLVESLGVDGEVPGLPGWEWIATPGHTPGHVAYFRRGDGVLLAGDAVLTVNLNSIPDLLLNRQRFAGPPYVSTWRWPAARRSVAKLAGLEPRVVAAGHGRPIAGPDAARRLRAFAEEFSGP
jgi:glyoxylase-like metal-dependent hydrolase (beta-lactamase superfamily II)